MFVLVPEHFTFDSAPAVIVASAYNKTQLDSAMASDRESFLSEDSHLQITDNPLVVAKSGAQFRVRQFRSAELKQQGYESVAYHQEGVDVIVLTLSAQTADGLRDSEPVFESLLLTFEKSPLKVIKGS